MPAIWDEVMAVVKAAVDAVAERAPRCWPPPATSD
jgi:hypothetical protein